MKSLREYLQESEDQYSRPVRGDNFAINIREECLLETYICDETADGIVLHADEKMMSLLESYGFLSDGDISQIEKDIAAAPVKPIASMESDVPVADAGEFDYEGDMAKDDLETIIRAARRLTGMLDDNENMPEWVQSKINKAADYVDTAADYIESNKEDYVAEGSASHSELARLAHEAYIAAVRQGNAAMANHYKQAYEKHKRLAASERKSTAKGMTEGPLHRPGEDNSPVAQAITRRILMQRTDLLAKYGPGYVGQAIDDVADSVGDWDEIGSSDVSGWVSQVEWNLKNKLNQYDEPMDEAKYQGREVPLGKPMKGDVKKSKVYVRGPKGNVVKVNFGQKGMKIKKNIPGRRKNFRARHNCDNPGPRWKARYWSCRAW